MYGAIIGDLAGSIYEYEQTKEIKGINIDKIIEDNSFYSDDTILSIAIADAIIHDRDYDKYLRYYINKYKDYKPNFNPYFKTAFSPSIIKWANSNEIGKSIGNGAMMRISPVGYLFDTEEEVITNSRLATIPSHNTEEAVDCATKIALIIYYLRKGLSLEEIFNNLKITPQYKQFTHFNTTCQETIDNCLYTLYNSNSFEDAIRKTIKMGGDTDTNACIVGSMAEALYGIENELIEEANNKLPKEFVKVLTKTK